eukprot:TRINITY_DN3012_c0_g1_i2.p1 TRINITY_DN3012_c0_g1~~TRINITY_DN3012_c0_g1_i2.p1  ORF type:complete len:397 (+),score=39.11 TRINITY_DN3012_c0_g1_i2:47-1192(+)
MQIFVSFPDAGYPDIVFEVTAKSLVADAAQAAADEWDVDVDFLEISFDGSLIPLNSQLMSHGVEGGSQLTASLLRVFGNKWFIDDTKRELLMRHLSRIDEQHLSLDTPTFATDGCFQFDMAWIPNEIEVSFVNPHPSVTSAEFRKADFWAREAFPVLKIDLLGLRNITSLSNYFLSRCTSLTTLDVSCLTNLTSIDNWILFECSALSTFELGNLNNLTMIGDGFLARCLSLSALDLDLENLTSVGKSFLHRCTSLSRLDVSCLGNLTSIGKDFLRECSSIRSLNLASLTNLTSVGSGFLMRCSSLSSLDLGGLIKLTTVGDSFIRECRSLSSLDVKGLSSITSVGNSFMLGTPAQTSISSLCPESVVRKRYEELRLIIHPQ